MDNIDIAIHISYGQLSAGEQARTGEERLSSTSILPDPTATVLDGGGGGGRREGRGCYVFSFSGHSCTGGRRFIATYSLLTCTIVLTVLLLIGAALHNRYRKKPRACFSDQSFVVTRYPIITRN